MRAKFCKFFLFSAKPKLPRKTFTTAVSTVIDFINNHDSNLLFWIKNETHNTHIVTNTVLRTLSHCSRHRQSADLRHSTCMEPIDRLGTGELPFHCFHCTPSLASRSPVASGCPACNCKPQRRRLPLLREPFLSLIFPSTNLDRRHVPKRESSSVARWQLPRSSPRSPQPQPPCAPLRPRRRLPSVEEGYYSPRDGPRRWRPLSVFGCRSSWKWLTWAVSPRKRFPRPAKRLELRRRGR